jgi:hypothetical protein
MVHGLSTISPLAILVMVPSLEPVLSTIVGYVTDVLYSHEDTSVQPDVGVSVDGSTMVPLL